jgi:uncharacterized protein GlcG (DUF336 family)
MIYALGLDTADAIANACLAAGRDSGFAPLTVAVLDAGGHTIVMKRGDGSGILRCEIAFGKAWGALGMGLSSRALAKRSAAAPMFFQAISAVSEGRLIPVPGGVLIRDADKRIVGAIGVSGDTSDNDEICAVKAVACAGLIPDTEER